jgi:hypothetical protein
MDYYNHRGDILCFPHVLLNGQPTDAMLWIPTSTPAERPILPTAGGHVFSYPGQMNLSFTCIQSKQMGQSLYFAAHDPVARYKVYRFIETGATGATDLAACIQHSPFLPPQRQYDGSPVVLQFLEGGGDEMLKATASW